MSFRWANEQQILGESQYLHLPLNPLFLDSPVEEGTKYLRNSGSLSVYQCVQKKSFPEEGSIYQHFFENIKPGTELPPPSVCFLRNPYLPMESK
jgi:hypothetical protein